MELNKVTSELEYLGTIIKKLVVENSLIDYDTECENLFGIEIGNASEVRQSSGKYVTSVSIAVFVDVLKAGEKKCHIELVVEGGFSAPEDIEKERFISLTAINGAAALYAICRARIEEITAATFSNGKIVLPFVNIYEYYRKKNTISD